MYKRQEDKRIAIDEGMSELQTLKTAIHEIAHAKLHDIDLNAPKEEQQPRVDRRTREVEAESVAYTVCQHYGLDTSDYSCLLYTSREEFNNNLFVIFMLSSNYYKSVPCLNEMGATWVLKKK